MGSLSSTNTPCIAGSADSGLSSIYANTDHSVLLGMLVGVIAMATCSPWCRGTCTVKGLMLPILAQQEVAIDPLVKEQVTIVIWSCAVILAADISYVAIFNSNIIIYHYTIYYTIIIFMKVGGRGKSREFPKFANLFPWCFSLNNRHACTIACLK